MACPWMPFPRYVRWTDAGWRLPSFTTDLSLLLAPHQGEPQRTLSGMSKTLRRRCNRVQAHEAGRVSVGDSLNDSSHTTRVCRVVEVARPLLLMHFIAFLLAPRPNRSPKSDESSLKPIPQPSSRSCSPRTPTFQRHLHDRPTDRSHTHTRTLRLKRLQAAKKQREKEKKDADVMSKRHAANVRVKQRAQVHIQGMTTKIANEDVSEIMRNNGRMSIGRGGQHL